MSATTRRLMKEAAELSASSPSPSPHFFAHPVSDSNLFDWHFTIAGPPAPSPYAGGVYHGRIVLPPQYPLRPPSFRFLTPSGRFEVNREICLSISGHHEETWQPAWGIRTALVAIRSFMDGDPKGQIGGVDAPDEVRRMLAQKSREWRCECLQGKTNAEALQEWREMCRSKGIDPDEEEKGAAPPKEMQLHVKNPPESAKSGNETNTTSVSQEQSSPPRAGTTESGMEQPRTTAAVATPRTPSAPSSTGSPPPNVSQESPWLDRAIIGVFIALVFMILRRLVHMDVL
ncbi:hypothetical protein VTN49DRAFT_1327 [Thermomyces lanuginosus]|uniref:uncharacterized protein n=1 Tax=Thermomyces lanuginosus TaxID=5541 RepID=UPI0037422870